MKKFFTFILTTCFILLVCTGTAFCKNEYDEDYSGARDVYGNWVFTNYDSTYNENYYSSLEGITDKSTLISKLYTLISTTKTKSLTYHSYDEGDYGATATVIAEMDEDPNNHNNVICLYTGSSYSKESNNIAWNQEHVWPQSHNVTGTRKSDVYNLRVTGSNVNSSRGNKDFDETTGLYYGTLTSDYDDRSFYDSLVFEPRDSVKGDIARILFYMDIMYPELELISSSSTEGNYMGNLEMLISWHEMDAVDDMERRRNDIGEYYQGNRNPFVDHPEYADIIFGSNYVGCQDKTITYSVSYVPGDGVTFDYTDESAYHYGDKVVEPTVNPTLNGFSFRGWYTDSSFIKKWNFSTNKITSNVVLYAKFEIVKTGLEAFSEILPSVALSFDYRVETNTIGEGEPVTNTITINPISGPGSIKVSENQCIDMTQYFDNNMYFDFFYNTNQKSAAYINNQEIRLYNGNGNGGELVIRSKNDFVTIDSITCSYDCITTSISANKREATLKNVKPQETGNIKVKYFEITYTYNSCTLVNYNIDNAYYKFQYIVPEDLYEDLEHNYKGFPGLEINNEFYYGRVSRDENRNYVVNVSYLPDDFTKDVIIRPAWFDLNDGSFNSGAYYYGIARTIKINDIIHKYEEMGMEKDIIACLEQLLGGSQ